MRRYIILGIAALIIVIGVIAILTLKAGLIERIAIERLEETFIGSKAMIRESRLGGRSLVFSGIEIKRVGFYNLEIKEVEIKYSIAALIIGKVDSVMLKDLSFKLKMGGELPEPDDLIRRSGGGVLRIDKAYLSNAYVSIDTRNIDLEGVISLDLSLADARVERIDAVIEKIGAYGVVLENGRIRGAPPDCEAEVSVDKISYKDFNLTDANGVICQDGSAFYLNSMTANLFNGMVRGDIALTSIDGGAFTISLNCAGLELEAFVEDFKLGDKVSISGKLGGDISINGKSFMVTGVTGGFLTEPPGGTLVIKDTRFMENMAERAGQSADLMMETFSNYRYTIGEMAVSLEGSDLLLDAALEGDAGKRELSVVIHDFIK